MERQPGSMPPAQYQSFPRIVQGEPNISQISKLPDPAANRMLFIKPDGTWSYLAPGTNVAISGTNLNVANAVSDGDKGDITVSGSGLIWTIDNGVVTYAKMQAVSATSKLLGSSATTTPVQEIGLGTNLSMSGTTLNAANAVSDGDKGDITVTSTGTVWTIDTNVLNTGSYTPTLTGTANVSATTAFSSSWLRVRNMVTVSGLLQVTPTTIALQTTLTISLPIASAFLGGDKLGGAAGCEQYVGGGAIYGDPVSDTAELKFIAPAALNMTFGYQFLYELV